MRTRRIAVVLAVVMAQFFLVACGSDEGTSPPAGSPATTPTTAATEVPQGSPEDPAVEDVILELWFNKGDRLFLVHREIPGTTAVGRAAIEALLQGPTADEKGDGVSTSIPAGTTLLDLDIADGTATVDLSGDYGSGGGSASMFARLAQVVFTLTQFATVDDVLFRMDGDEVEVFSSEGIVLDEPQTRADYEDQLPAIVVTSPRRGQTVGTTVTIAGTANVFEATVSIRIVSDSGEMLAETFTTATCGTGCRGDYSIDVPVEVASQTEAVVWVFESSAEDGRPTKIVKVPVTVVP